MFLNLTKILKKDVMKLCYNVIFWRCKNRNRNHMRFNKISQRNKTLFLSTKKKKM